jgi:2-polyprenyl-6-hydroxyphenyl methylase/3-demethylubiquinone-9 3-methyltransferase
MPPKPAAANLDAAAVAAFDAQAERWWSRRGDMRGLHDINPVRVDYVRRRTNLTGARLLDVGCGGGLLSESLADAGAMVTGIDMAPAMLEAARRHLRKSVLSIDYRLTTAETLAEKNVGAFDVVVCMELLEHVPDPGSLIGACARLARPGGDVFFATLNRTPAARVLAVWTAERLLGIVPKNTHDWRRFIRPEELCALARKAGLQPRDIRGLRYVPYISHCRLTRDTSINYLGHFVRESDRFNGSGPSDKSDPSGGSGKPATFDL